MKWFGSWLKIDLYRVLFHLVPAPVRDLDQCGEADEAAKRDSRVCAGVAHGACKDAGFSYELIFPMPGGPLLEVKQDDNTTAYMACKKGWTDATGDPQLPSKFITNLPSGTTPE